MNKHQEVSRLISKYALIMIVLYGIHDVFQYFLPFYLKEVLSGSENSFWYPFIVWGFNLILNLVVASFVASDLKKYQPKSKYLILLTILYRPIGVCLMLISLVVQKDGKE